MHTDVTFERLALIEPLLKSLHDEGYATPSPIQAEAIPAALAGKDLLATAQTGTGKTAAFALPILQRLHQEQVRGKQLRTLILTPTRELALQIHENFGAYGRHLPLTSAVIVGGVAAGPQIQCLRRKPQILIATPGRLLDLMSQGHVVLDAIEIAVLDEADRMLDMGFIRDVRRIFEALPKKRQTLLFSATLPQEITNLANDMLQQPTRVAVAPTSTVADNIEQQVLFVEKADKRALLSEILKEHGVERALVFTRTKHRANRVARDLAKNGISADAIHSNKSQGARQRALGAFERGQVRVLVATDIVARGIDVDGISHVINFELPNEPEAYVHRIGRTARAGAEGIAISFCEDEELAYLRDIERLTGIELDETDDHSFHCDRIANMHADGRVMPKASKKSGQAGNGQGRRGQQDNRRNSNTRRPHSNGATNSSINGSSQSQPTNGNGNGNRGSQNRETQNARGGTRRQPAARPAVDTTPATPPKPKFGRRRRSTV